MSNFRRRLMMSFEKKYTPVKYLESTGTQYIDTGIYPKSTTKIDFAFKFIVDNNIRQYNGWGSTSHAEAFLFGIQDNYFSSVVNSSWVTSNVKKAKEFDTDTHTLMLKSGKQMFDNDNYGNDTIGDSAINNQTMYLFATHVEWTGTPQYWCKERIYYTKIYDGDNLVRDFVPVIDSSGIPCLYDKVEDKFYYNEGSGEFLYE